jgi:hypothetical protein
VGLFFGFFIANLLTFGLADSQPTSVVFVGKSNVIFFADIQQKKNTVLLIVI